MSYGNDDVLGERKHSQHSESGWRFRHFQQESMDLWLMKCILELWLFIKGIWSIKLLPRGFHRCNLGASRGHCGCSAGRGQEKGLWRGWDPPCDTSATSGRDAQLLRTPIESSWEWCKNDLLHHLLLTANIGMISASCRTRWRSRWKCTKQWRKAQSRKCCTASLLHDMQHRIAVDMSKRRLRELMAGSNSTPIGEQLFQKRSK